MLPIWLLTGISALFGLATGLVNAGAPQAAIAKLNLSSSALGLVGAGLPAGYAAGCFLSASLYAGFSGKRVLLCGAACAILALVLMAGARDTAVLVVAQIVFGLASGAVWPFISAWLLDYESTGVPKARLLRHYNVSWTGGTAAGMYLGGLLCDRGWVFESFIVGAICAASAFIVAAVTHEASAHRSIAAQPDAESTYPRAVSNRVTFATMVAAALFNFCAIGTKIIISVNYAELNQQLEQSPSRMGLLIAVGTLAQLAAFGLSKWFEPWLGLRRVYVIGALVLIGVNLAFSRVTLLSVLVLAEAALGFALAVAFQCSIFAFIARSRTPRHGTTVFETTIGISGLAPLAAGKLSQVLKESGAETLEALRAPFYAAMAVVAVMLAVQMFLVPAERAARRLGCDA